MSTHYVNHSGNSTNGAACGAFPIGAGATSDVADWGRGAALSFSRLSTHYILHGGYSNGGAYFGAFYVVVTYDTSITYWAIGAALSFIHIHIMLFEVVFLAMAFIVVHSLFLFTFLLVLQTGPLALLYHLNY